jgi:hypothetical protein
MTVDERLRDAHARVPDPDPATVARARARLTAALDEAPAPARRRRRLTFALPALALAAAVAAVVVLAGGGKDVEREAAPPAAGGPIAYQRNTFAVGTRYIAADGSPNAGANDAAYAIAWSVPEEIWRAPDGSGRIAYGKESAPYLPSPADERAWRAAGAPDLEQLAGEPGTWGPKRTDYGPGELDAALLLNSNLEAVLPERDPLSVLPTEPRALAAWLDTAAAKQRRGAPESVVRDAVVSDVLTFLRDARASLELRTALVEVLSTLDGARELPAVRDGAGREWPGIELAGGLVVAYDPRSRRVMAQGSEYEDGVRWVYTYAVVSSGVSAVGRRP